MEPGMEAGCADARQCAAHYSLSPGGQGGSEGRMVGRPAAPRAFAVHREPRIALPPSRTTGPLISSCFLNHIWSCLVRLSVRTARILPSLRSATSSFRAGPGRLPLIESPEPMMNLQQAPWPATDPGDAGPARPARFLDRLARALCVLRMLPLVLGLASAGCSMRSDLEFTTLMNEVPAAQAIMIPPPGGPAIVSVLERRYLNGVSQEISLSTMAGGSGQNTFWISLVNDPRALTENDDSLSIGRLDPLRIYNEIEDRLPGIGMQTSNYFVQNKYGPFGYAVGRSGASDLRLYAWQLIEPTEAAIFMTSGTVSVRMRVCAAGATEQQLLQVMYGYTIAAYFRSPNWNPYGSVPPASPSSARSTARSTPWAPPARAPSFRPPSCRRPRWRRRPRGRPSAAGPWRPAPARSPR